MLPTKLKNKVILALVILVTGAFIASCSSNSGDTTTGGGSAGSNGFQALLGDTYTHDRCINCHGFQEGNAVSQRHEVRSKVCTTCHGGIISDWHAPDASFSFTGLSTQAMCEKSKAKFGNDVAKLQDHLKFDRFVLWGVDSGDVPLGAADKPKAPPGSAAAWRTLIDQWVAAGAVCD